MPKYLLILLLLIPLSLRAQTTETQYLSGTDKDHTVKWKFFCTAGRNSGKWTTIGVPSNWELQGFGKYNYGHDKDTARGKEKGLYKYSFKVPANWQGKTINIVFEGAMTDTEVKINGQSAGAMHQGSYYRFKYDISKLLKYGKTNLLEATVAKHSANESVNGAERRGDFWIFGGIFRPVYLEALPPQHIERITLDAKADGSFKSDVYLGDGTSADEVVGQLYTLDGQKAGQEFKGAVTGGNATVHLETKLPSPRLWTSETPNLYRVVMTLRQGGKAVHTVNKKFGFRTVELREREGFYVNGTKIKFKGVCRHSFWPSSGRTMSKALSIEDVNLMKDMNMNAVRMSHYPPDEHFLEVCDSLGLFVLDEVAGWHAAYDTQVGTKLTEEMVKRDQTHPSIVVWVNGNEGGHNFDLDPVLDRMDMQKRPVVHAWQVFRGTDTQHYINYDYGNGTHLQGHNIVFPTEFLHGLYDGGHGAGLQDYWEQMWREPLSAGGFLWDFADAAVVRTDKGGILDVDGDHAPDGILGPYHEKEGSYYTIKEVWSPVFFERREITPAFDGTFRVQNRYHYLNLNQCRFTWKLAQLPSPGSKAAPVTKTGTVTAPSIAPTEFGPLKLSLPADWQQQDVLYITAIDPAGREIYTWSWPIAHPAQVAQRLVSKQGGSAATVSESDSLYTASANGITLAFSRKTGLLRQVRNAKGIIPLSHGPVLAEGETAFEGLSQRQEGQNVVIDAKFGKASRYQSLQWTVYPSGWVKMTAKYFPKDYDFQLAGLSFNYPEKEVKGIQWRGDGPYRVWKDRLKGTNLGVWSKDYNNTSTGEPDGTKSPVYPEFKGYYSNFYWLTLQTTGQPLTILCDQEDVYLRLFTPRFGAKPYNTAPPFPSGNLSFMHGIPPIGTKSQKPENMGPMGRANMYYDYSKDPSYAKEMTLYFDFSGKQAQAPTVGQR
ncbi:glycoside hydrolase family 2 protein [Hymenobacter crusticola]|uniref:beta-galactosidase n=1 Tax=Hymenobacter crusticola TaxID=1770526 RepID=A0A243WCX6_9BACT|nr:glycoside hydrolase family 2 TIM barrel-domain containing protein [Hymenobacter crusticola]OUJ73519.1 glycosyl transferase family 2 [Hymenobacter crusticola]